MDEYYIENGVHRAVAAREAGLQVILAVLYVDGQAPQLVAVPLDRLRSPKPTISRSEPRCNLTALEQAMSTTTGRAQIPPIDIQPLGAAGQSASVPLAQVTIGA